MDFDDGQYAQVPKKAKLTRALDILPSSASIKNYAPYPKTQGTTYGTCTAWSSAYGYYDESHLQGYWYPVGLYIY